ncbi:hypothetical protein GH714_020100 [Hevea brasiliensis]|uniref:Uncharacterized protein n=1 Tax=Hevea brasiliensis TaxID=3981 RepID=A0A6A6LZ12_HEVBR|nr:hypothetical protein GH714_020100 [Hevea brasiliensis]
MDFHSLARKELQALCKKNKIPANMTNVAMADALKALEKVEGLDELNNEPRSNPQESPERTTNAEPRTACRTSTRRKPINVEPESSQPVTRTRRATRRTVAEEAEQENKKCESTGDSCNAHHPQKGTSCFSTPENGCPIDGTRGDEKLVGQEKSDVPETPAMRTSQRKAPAVSTRRKTEARRMKNQFREYTEGDGSEVLSLGNLEHSLGNESEMKHEFQEDNKTNDHEIDNSVVSFQKLDQPLENGSEMKNEPNEHNNNADHEVYSEVLCQNIDQLHKSESETKLKHQEDKRGNDHEVVDCNAEIEIGSESCTNLDNDSGLGEDDEDNCESSDESFFQQVETSEVDMNCESMDEKGSHVVITENSETLNAALKPEIEELNGNQDSMIVEVSDDSSAFVMETIVNVPDEVSVEVMDSLIPEVSEAEGKSSEINLMEDEQHGSDDPHSDPATEKDSDGNAIEELPDGSRSDEVQENDNAAKIQEKAPFLPQVEYEKSESRKDEPESPRFILQHEKCKEASDNLSNEYNIDDVIVIEAKESDIHDQKSPFCCPLVSDSEIAGKIPLVDIPEEEFAVAAYECVQTLNKSPTSLKQMSPYQTVVSGDQVTGGMVISSPFAANTIQDFNKENIDNSGRKVEPNKEKVKKKIVEEEKKYEDFSVRQLTKMLKEKLEIANQKNGGVSKVGTRPALQVLTENCKAAGEPEKKN